MSAAIFNYLSYGALFYLGLALGNYETFEDATIPSVLAGFIFGFLFWPFGIALKTHDVITRLKEKRVLPPGPAKTNFNFSPELNAKIEKTIDNLASKYPMPEISDQEIESQATIFAGHGHHNPRFQKYFKLWFGVGAQWYKREIGKK